MTSVPPNLREAVEIMAKAVCPTHARSGQCVMNDVDALEIDRCTADNCAAMADAAAALRALLAQGFNLSRWEPIETAVDCIDAALAPAEEEKG